MRTNALATGGLLAALLTAAGTPAAEPHVSYVQMAGEQPGATRMFVADPAVKADAPVTAGAFVGTSAASPAPAYLDQRQPPQPDDWIAGARPGCCGPVGRNGPLGYEIYNRTGLTMPVADRGFLRNGVAPGILTQFGSRTLFYNPYGDAAWTADIGLSYAYNNGRRQDQQIELIDRADIPFVSVRSLQRSSVDIAGGREWFVNAPAFGPPMSNWRFGADAGGRWGYARVEFNDETNPNNPGNGPGFIRRSDVFGAVFLALHTDCETAVTNCTTLVTGFRAEWEYFFSDVVPNSRSQFQSVNLMFNVGLRF